VRLELSPMKQTEEPEWKIKTVSFFETIVFMYIVLYVRVKIRLFCHIYILKWSWHLLDYMLQQNRKQTQSNVT